MKNRIAKLVNREHVNDFTCTIHGFCVKFLRREIHRIGYPKTFTIIDEEDAKALKDAALALYTKVSEYALTRGLILADTKFEFGKIDGKLVVADEMFTPDSSRFWDLSDYEPGRAQKSFDKQYLREWLETLDWDKTYPAPTLPEEIINKTAEKYRECYRLLTGKELA